MFMQPAQHRFHNKNWVLFIGQTPHQACCCCLLVCVPRTLLWISAFDTANKACGCDGTVCAAAQPERRASHVVELGDGSIKSLPFFSHHFFSTIHWWRVGDEKIITLWLLTFPCMVSCWYNSITFSNKPFQKHPEPDFNWAANQLLLALIWLSHSWIAFDDGVRCSRWDNHLRYPALIPALNNTGDTAGQVRKAVTPNQAEAPKHPTGGWEKLEQDWFVSPFSVTTSKQLIYQEVDGSVPYRIQEDFPLCLSFTYAIASGFPPGEGGGFAAGSLASVTRQWLSLPGAPRTEIKCHNTTDRGNETWQPPKLIVMKQRDYSSEEP